MSAATSTAHSQDRKDAFRRLIRDVSEKLLESEVSQIYYLRDVPPTATGTKKTGLDVLIALEKVGTFSPWKTEPLIKLLEDVKRFDVANYVREQYQTKYPDAANNSHRQISRAVSKSLPFSQSPDPHRMQRKKLKRSQTVHVIPEIVVTSPETQSQPQSAWQGAVDSPADFFIPPLSISSGEVSLHSCAVTTENELPHHTHDSCTVITENDLPHPTHSEQFDASMIDNTSKGTLYQPLLNKLQNESDADARPIHRTMSQTYSSRPPQNEDLPSLPRCWTSPNPTINITVNVSPTSSPAGSKSGSCDMLPSGVNNFKSCKPQAKSRNLSYPNKDVRSLKPKFQGHPTLNTSHSAPGDMYQQQCSRLAENECEDELDKEDVESDSSALMKHKEQDESTGIRPRSKVLSLKHKPKASGDSTSHQSIVVSQKGVSTHKSSKGSRKITLPGRKAKSEHERTTQCTWTIKRESLRDTIWNHRCLHYVQYSEPVPIDIERGDLNPYLSLRLYPDGLFDDERKSMTLFVKVVLPDDCPPLLETGTFAFSWEIRTDTAVKLNCSKKPIKVCFDKGVVYVHKFLLHSALLQHHCSEFEIRISLSTSYIHAYCSHNMDIHNTTKDCLMIQDTGGAEQKYLEERPTLPTLLTFKTEGGNRNIAQEIGNDHLHFGCILLSDETGAVTKGTVHTNSDPTSINQEILRLWLQGRGRKPVVWSTLIETLKDISMNTLATDIEQNLKLNITEQSSYL